MNFPTKYHQIIERIDAINPIAYSKTRNYTDGAVTRLSPYISRGVISLPMIKNAILKKYNLYQSEKLLQELAWREYWLRVWESKGDKIFTDLSKKESEVQTNEIPVSIMNANTGIKAIDKSIRELYETGYMHNHCRMYVASIVCNIAKTHWLTPSRWMYYHLLDGDLASNSLSWQWVAGTFSSKKYYCNQDNINKYCHTDQRQTFLDKSYDELPHSEIPLSLRNMLLLTLETKLPKLPLPLINRNYPTLIYNSYNLDPLWYSGEKANRILLLEPSHFKKFPVNEKVLEFILALSTNIADIKIFVGEFQILANHTNNSKMIFKKHPTCNHYKGEAESYNYLFPEISGYFPSFFSYWKKCKKFLI